MVHLRPDAILQGTSPDSQPRRSSEKLENRLRIAYVLHRFPHLPETFIVNEMVDLQKNSVSVDVYSLMPPKSQSASPEAEPLVDKAHHSPFMSVRVARAQVKFILKKPGSYFSAIARLIWLTWREPRVMGLVLALFPKAVHFADLMVVDRVDHIHANFVWIEALLADSIRSLTDITYTIRPHAFGLFSRNPKLVRHQLEGADGVVTVSEYHRRFIRDLSPELAQSRIDVVYCGIDTKHWSPSDSSGGTGFRILSVGRSVPKKGHEHLVKACALLAERRQDFTCGIVAGEGPGQARLQELIDQLELNDHVRLLPNHDEGGILELMRSSDVFALACVVAPNGDRDGIPVALMEAMSAGVPVVTTPVAGIPELVIDGETGLLAPQGDPIGLADALDRIMDDPDLRRRLSERGRRHVVCQFSTSNNTAHLIDVFDRFVASDKG